MGEGNVAKRKRRHRRNRAPVIVLTALVFLTVAAVLVLSGMWLKQRAGMMSAEGSGTPSGTLADGQQGDGEPPKELQSEAQKAAEAARHRQEIFDQAQYLADTYDYDAALDLLGSIANYDTDTEAQQKCAEYEALKASCVPVNLDEVTHIFYHTLVVDPTRAFANQETDRGAVGNNQWMTTVSEFEKITQEMYDRGFVMVSIHDLVELTTDENGNEVMQASTILLPPGKKAFVLSLDDMCYYHSYDNYGYASKLVLDEEGNVTNEYIQADGTVVRGSYDAVPLMDDFIREHPDASYHGAKGIIALTGYNGILGYRTDESYVNGGDDLDDDKKRWLEDHPDFNLEEERAQAKAVADAMKANGWEFASHTWGHLRVGDSSLELLQADNERWKRNVEPLVGETDAILFAHGQDLGAWGDYDEDNQKFQYFMSEGFRIFCDVDSKQYCTWLGKDYLRQGRRNLDGYRIYNDAIGKENYLSDLFDAAEIIDPLRPPVHELS